MRVEVEKDGAVGQARIIALPRFEGNLRAEAKARREHDAAADIHEHAVQAGSAIKLPSPKVSMFSPGGFGVRAGGANVNIQTGLRVQATPPVNVRKQRVDTDRSVSDKAFLSIQDGFAHSCRRSYIPLDAPYPRVVSRIGAFTVSGTWDRNANCAASPSRGEWASGRPYKARPCADRHGG